MEEKITQNISERNDDSKNSGNYNMGMKNTGDANIGNDNSGDQNKGDKNSGCANIGDENSGFGNIGNNNSGCFNLSDYNNGCFNTEPQPITFFNQPSDWTMEDFITSEAFTILKNMPAPAEWIPAQQISPVDPYIHTEVNDIHSGYLRILSEEELKEMRQEWWNGLSEMTQQEIIDLPNFDAEIFYQTTGIRI